MDGIIDSSSGFQSNSSSFNSKKDKKIFGILYTFDLNYVKRLISKITHNSQENEKLINSNSEIFDCHHELELEERRYPERINFRSYNSQEDDSLVIIDRSLDTTQILLPNQTKITNAPFFWGNIPCLKANELLANEPDGTFLLRLSSSKKHLFSLTFKRFTRVFHVRIDINSDSSIKLNYDMDKKLQKPAKDIFELINNYNSPDKSEFYEPICQKPFMKRKPLSLQEACRSKICDIIHEKASRINARLRINEPTDETSSPATLGYQSNLHTTAFNLLDQLPFPKKLIDYLRFYSVQI